METAVLHWEKSRLSYDSAQETKTTSKRKKVESTILYYHGKYLEAITLRVQVPNNHILTQNLCHNFYYQKPKYLIIWYMDPLGYVIMEK